MITLPITQRILAKNKTMKKLFTILFLLSFLNSNSAQDLSGKWMGILKLQGMELDLYFNISKKENNYSATLDVPKQGAKGIPVTAIELEDSTLNISVGALGMTYMGIIKNDSIVKGEFNQRGTLLPLDLKRVTAEATILVRPQTPKAPFPYQEEKITFRNTKDQITLAGTLTLPKNTSNFPTVILISGSGPQNRNSEIFGHQPFWVIADYLTRQGIGVLRFDDRGTEESQGDFSAATSLDFAEDVRAAVAYLKSRNDIAADKIGLIGHSEGGAIAPLVASEPNTVGFIILLAGPGMLGKELLLLQKATIEKASGIPAYATERGQVVFGGAYDRIINSDPKDPTLRDSTIAYFRTSYNNLMPEDQLHRLAEQLTSPWMMHFIKYDPTIALQKVQVPVLALNGEKDLQVPAKENLTAIEAALTKGGNTHFSTQQFPKLNHLFQTCETGLVSEYGLLEETFSEEVLKEITIWIKKNTGN